MSPHQVTITISNSLISKQLQEIVKEIDSKLPNLKLQPTSEQLESIKSFRELVIKGNEVEDVSQISEAIKNYKNSEENLINLLNERFPNIDSKRFIKIFFHDPLSSGNLDLSIYDNLFTLFEYKNGHADLNASITVGKSVTATKKFKFVTPEFIVNTLTSITISLSFFIASTLTSNTDQLIKHEEKMKTEIVNELENHQLIIYTELKQQGEISKGELEKIELEINKLIENQEKTNTKNKQLNISE
ncbi:hypothetical protein [Cytobacillus sp.]|uniref:hypothetical protein n=1 Tax=Cytobacillus sp. TaxID=2675269 RepID=UPI0028BF1F45|nr:hypothetical protein [Cytobacillus sp.]